MNNTHRRTAFIIGASILGGGILIASTALITKAIVESQYNKNNYKVIFNGYKCHLNGDTTVKKGTTYSAIITSDNVDYDSNVYSVKMGDNDVDYTFNNGHLIINKPTTGNITINAIATDRTKVYATGKFNKIDDTHYEVVGVDSNDLASVTDLYIPDFYTDPTTNEEVPVTSIKEGALYGLSNLQNLTIPFIGSSNTFSATAQQNLFGCIFGEKLFEGVRTLTWQYYGSGEEDYFGAAIPSSLKTVNVINGGSQFGRGAFNNCLYLEEVNINLCTANTLSESMFEGCSCLNTVTYPENITTIDKNCFHNCSSLVEVDFRKIGTGVTTINESAFDNCASAQRIRIPQSINTIEQNAFANLSTAIIFTDAKKVDKEGKGWVSNWAGDSTATPIVWEKIDPTPSHNDSFQYFIIDETTSAFIVSYIGPKTTEITIPATIGDNNTPVTHIGSLCFAGIPTLKNVKIEATGLLSIGAYAFQSCTALETINLNSCPNLSSLGTGCFYECNELRVDDSSGEAFLPNKTTNIGNYCFYNCHHILNINLKNIKSLGDYSFAYCCYNYVDPITGDLVFSDKDYKGNNACLTDVQLSTSLNKIGIGTFMNCRELKAISVDKGEGTSIFDNIPDFCFYHTKIGPKAGFKVTETLKTIGAYAFGYCSYLSKLDFSDAKDVISIGEGAFINCVNISGDVTLPETLASIGAYAFEECVKLESVNIKSLNITSVPFDFCFDCESLKSVSFAGNLTEIDDFGFGGCKSLTTFNNSTNPELPNTVERLGNYCFSNCASLKSIKLSANSSVENGIKIGSNVFAGWTKDQTIYLNSNLFDYYKKAKTVVTKFGWQMNNRTKIFGILSDNYSCEASGSSNVIITVQ